MVRRRIKTQIVIIIVIVAIIAISFLIMIKYMKKLSESATYYDRGIGIIQEADYIVVPGAKITKSMPTLMLRHRLEYAYQLYKEKKAPKIIISGGFDEEIGKYETEVMYEYLVRLGVKKEDIISDLKGDSTYDTLKRTKEFVKDKKVIFCTQEMYSDRAIYIANCLKLDMDVFCSDAMIYADNGKNKVREILAQVKAILNCAIFPPKTTDIKDVPFLF